MSAVYSALTGVILKSLIMLSSVQDLNWIGGDVSFERAHKPEHFGHFRFLIPVPNRQFWINVIGSVVFLVRKLSLKSRQLSGF